MAQSKMLIVAIAIFYFFQVQGLPGTVDESSVMKYSRPAGNEMATKSKLFKGSSFEDDHQQPYFDDSTEQNVTSYVGQSAYLRCGVKQLGNGTVSWIRWRDYHILTIGRYTYTSDQRFESLHLPLSNTWTLNIKYIQKTDAGIYECKVGWDHGSISQSFSLNVLVPKASILGAADHYIKVGRTINLTCVITHIEHSLVHVFWFHNGSKLNYNSEREGVMVSTIRTKVATSTLLIANAQHSDSGNYTCSPSSTDETSTTVHVVNEDNGDGVLVQRLRATLPFVLWVLGKAMM